MKHGTGLTATLRESTHGYLIFVCVKLDFKFRCLLNYLEMIQDYPLCDTWPLYVPLSCIKQLLQIRKPRIRPLHPPKVLPWSESSSLIFIDSSEARRDIKMSITLTNGIGDFYFQVGARPVVRYFTRFPAARSTSLLGETQVGYWIPRASHSPRI